MKLISVAEFDGLKAIEGQKGIPVEGEKNTFFKSQDAASELLTDLKIPDDIKTVLYSSILKNLNKNLGKLQDSKSEIIKEIKPNNTIDTSSVVSESYTKQLQISDSDTQLLESLPSSLRWKGKYILLLLKPHSHIIKWDELGVCSFFNEEKTLQTNIVDLIRYVLSTVKYRKPPLGLNRFLLVLKITNVPTSILNTRLRSEFVQQQNPKPKGNRESSSSVSSLWKNMFGRWENYDSSQNDLEFD